MSEDEASQVEYRAVDTYLCKSGGHLDLRQLNFVQGDVLIQRMKQDPTNFLFVRTIFPEPLADVEMQAPKSNSTAIISLALDANHFLEEPVEHGTLIFCYMAGDTQETVLKRIRSEFTKRMLLI